MDAIEKQIHTGADKAGKSYAYDEAHDQTQPAQWWFQQSPQGLTLFVVFYTQACRWSRCLGCNLPMLMSEHPVDFGSIMAQVDAVLTIPEVVAKHNEIGKVIVSNNGSVLDQETFSSTALLYLLAKLNLHVPNLSMLSFETRPEYVEIEELEFLARALAEGQTPTQLELAVGFEAFDNTIRNDRFDKGLSFRTFEKFLETVSPYGYAVKCYFMLKPVPGMSDADAIADIHQAIDYLAEMAARYSLPIGMHLNPTYAAIGTPLVEALEAGRFAPPTLQDVAAALKHGEGKNVSIVVGLSDEGLAVPGGSFLRPGDEELVQCLTRFNQTQDYSSLPTI